MTSRKIVLSYIYEHIFWELNFPTNINEEYIQEHCSYLYEQFFCYKKKPQVDRDYIIKIGKNAFNYKEEVFEEVNKHTETFTIDRMDKMEQAIFLLGYCEMKELQTPKKILINELIELSKRYGDQGTKKLINGIFHKIYKETRNKA